MTESEYRIAVDAKGYWWRVFPDGWLSMVPTKPDGCPIPHPLTFYVPEEALSQLREALESDDVKAQLIEVATNQIPQSSIVLRTRYERKDVAADVVKAILRVLIPLTKEPA